MTSTLQQEAGRKLRFSSKRAMQVAQRLYEHGCITYMRTDSTTLSDQALDGRPDPGRGAVRRPPTCPPQPRRYERKVKNAQEAHEAIRPAGETFRTPDEAARSLSGDEFRLYDLIWKRTVASQMADATGTSAQVRLVGDGAGRRRRRRGGRVLGHRARSSSSPASCGPMSRARTIPRPSWPTARSACPPWPRATPVAVGDLEPGGRTPPSRRPATPRRRWSRPWRSSASDAPPPTPASSPPSSTGATCGRRARRSCRRFTAFAVVGLLEQLLRRPGRLRVHRVDGGRPRRDRRRRRGVAALADPLLLRDARCRHRHRGNGRRRRRGPGLKATVAVAPGRHRRPRGQLDPDRRRAPTARRSWPGSGRYGPYLQRGEDRALASPTTWRPTS